jgi:tetratricopeptide (TPR) repeat protein
VAVVGCLVLAGLSGCGAKGDPPEIVKARKHLQLNESKNALESLSRTTTAQGYWLKAICLERMEQLDDARGQIEKALEIDPSNSEYRGFLLRLKLYKADMKAVDEILTLREENRASAALALFSFYAHVARSVHLKMTNHEADSRVEGGRAMQALNSAITLGAEIPEFQREILSLAIKSQMIDNADLVSGKLVEAAPDDPGINQDRLTILTAMHQYDLALPVAEHLYNLKSRSEEMASQFASVLERSSATTDHDRMFEVLIADHPKQYGLVVKRAVYLTRSRRFKEGLKDLDTALAAQTDADGRRLFIDSIMTIALESGEVEICEERLEKYRKEIKDPLVIAYFEGRIRYLQKDYVGALRRLSQVLEGQKGAVGTNRHLAMEAMQWSRRIMADREAAEALDAAAREIRVRAGLETADEPAMAEVPEPRVSRKPE